MAYNVQGLDLSFWQGVNVDFNKIQKSGIDFVVLRAGYWDEEDTQFNNYYKKAKAAGLNVGAYWYCYGRSVDEVKMEARTFLSVLKGKQFEYPVYMDFEDPTQTGLSKELKTEMVESFCGIMEEANYYVGIYANKNWLENHFIYDRISRYDIWIAHWVSETNYKNPYQLWQYTSDGSVNGVEGRVDRNVSYKPYKNIISKLGKNGFTTEVKPPVTPPTPKTLEIGRIDLYNDKYQKYPNPSVKPKTVEVLGESADYIKIKHSAFTPNIVWIKKADMGKAPSPAITKGGKVKVRSGAKDFTGNGLASFVYTTVYDVQSLNGKRAVIGLNGQVTAAVHVDNLIKQ